MIVAQPDLGTGIIIVITVRPSWSSPACRRAS